MLVLGAFSCLWRDTRSSFSRAFERDGDAHSAALTVADIEPPAVEFDDFFRHGQTQPHAFSGRFCAEKRLEDFAQILRRDSRAGVLDFDLQNRLARAQTRPRAVSGVKGDLGFVKLP